MLDAYHTDAYTYLLPFEEAIAAMREREWSRMERAFQDVKSIFAEYNKWED